LFFCSGCASRGVDDLTPDMERREVLSILRKPTSTEWDGRVEGLYFAATENRPEFCVKLYRGRVLVYGPYPCAVIKERK